MPARSPARSSSWSRTTRNQEPSACPSPLIARSPRHALQARIAAKKLARSACRRWSPSQPDDQVSDLGGLGEEWVVAGVEFHDAGCSTGELALPVGGGALVLRADEIRRGHVLPGR